MKQYGLIGYPLSHSFSKKYFTQKFENEQITDSNYELYEIENIQDFPKVITQIPNLKGLNVTIPHKQNVMPFMTRLDPATERIGAVNTIKVMDNGDLIGYNSDYYGFKTSLLDLISDTNLSALILGTGGASKAVKVALEDLNIDFQYVSRKKNVDLKSITYEEVTPKMMEKYQLIINTTPLGMSPKTETFPVLPYQGMNETHYLYDLVYNPEMTVFMQKGLAQGAKVINGLKMLQLQAEKSWRIWNDLDNKNE